MSILFLEFMPESALLYGSGACVAAGVNFFAPVVKGFYKSPWGWNVLYNLSSLWTWIAFGYSSIVLVPGIAATTNGNCIVAGYVDEAFDGQSLTGSTDAFVTTKLKK